MSSVILFITGLLSIIILCQQPCLSLHLVYVGKGMNYDQALRACRGRGMELAAVRNHHENNQLFNYARRYGRYWINANDRQQERVWKYANGRRVSYTRWHRGEPNNYRNEDCVHGMYFGNSDWNDVSCGSRNAVICMKHGRRRRRRRRRYGKTIHRNQIVYAGNNMNYNQALAECRRRRMNLIRIPNAQTNNIVYQMAVRLRVGRYWINANDIRSERHFKYANGHPIQFSKWHRGEPNNYHNEDCVHGLFYKNAQWNDISCQSRNAVFCYSRRRRTVIRIRENQLVIAARKVTYFQALKACGKLGLKLIRIQNHATNNMIYRWARKQRLGKYWIDANDIQKEGHFVYTDGRSITFRRFHGGEPNNYFNEDCVHGGWYGHGFWNDIKCSDRHTSAICYGNKKVVVEEKPVVVEEKPIVVEEKPVIVEEKPVVVEEKPIIETEVITKTIVKDALFVETELTFEEAIHMCVEQGQKLMHIENGALNKEIISLLQHVKEADVWINVVKNKDGQWTSKDGKKLKYENFGRSTGGNCAVINSDKGLWNASDCNSRHKSFCFKN